VIVVSFITSLSREAQGTDFRVIAETGGYGEVIRDLERQLAQALAGTFEIVAQRDYTRAFLRITVNRESFTRDGSLFRFDGSVGEFLDLDGHETGNFVTVMLSIDPTPTQDGQTVGVLRMERFVRLSPAV
jgi:hypothetical protein